MNSKTNIPNVVLVGMAYSGKSTVGAALAKRLDKPFTDTDDIITSTYRMSLQQIINNNGVKSFLEIEESLLLEKLQFDQKLTGIVATGGSVVYSQPLMDKITSNATVINLDITYDIFEQRAGNTGLNRGIIIPNGGTFRDLYDERQPLYTKYKTVDGTMPVNRVVDQILFALMN